MLDALVGTTTDTPEVLAEKWPVAAFAPSCAGPEGGVGGAFLSSHPALVVGMILAHVDYLETGR